MAKPKRPRPPKGRKNHDDGDDDDDSNPQAVVPSPRDTSSNYYQDEVDKFHEAKTASLLAAGVQLQSDDDFSSDNEEVMALDDEGDDDDDDDEESESAESDLDENLPGELPSGLNKKLYRAAARAKVVSQDEGDAEDQESMASDLEDRLHDEMPNELAWGQRKKLYYDTDYVSSDRKKGVSQEEEEAEANEEEAEAQRVQQRLVGNLDEDDFGLDFLQAFPQKAKPAGQKIEKDLKKMSEKEKLKLLKKESPELLELLEDLRAKLKELEEKLKPLVQMVKDGTIPRGKGSCYIETKNQLYLNYCTNISYYLVLKAKRIPVHGHPVIERLVSYRNLINELEVVDQRLSSELDLLLNKGGKKNATSVKTPTANISKEKFQKKNNKLSKKAILDVSRKEQVDSSDLDDEAALQYYRAAENALQRKRNRAVDTAQGDQADDDDFSPDAKRGITYQIAKNKGLTPKRKKIDRNPRVKHREKFRRAKIRRKGQVREVRKEESRYSGELSGIRAGIKKSIKLK